MIPGLSIPNLGSLGSSSSSSADASTALESSSAARGVRGVAKTFAFGSGKNSASQAFSDLPSWIGWAALGLAVAGAFWFIWKKK